MALAIPVYGRFPGNSYTAYKLFFTNDYLVCSRIAGVPPLTTDSGEIIITFDWRQYADGNSYSTLDIAPILARALTSTNFIPELNGHALCELPIHLIGHSRGGSLMCETSRILGTNGIWVDHLTTIDPHPLNDASFPLDSILYQAVDAPCNTYENVLFHDNLWQRIDFFVYGKSVPGAYIRELLDLSGGYYGRTTWYLHANTHLWYHGTLDMRVGATDTEASISASERNTWWLPPETNGAMTGFYYSRIGNGLRTSTFSPAGIQSTAIRDGYNQNWDLGGGISGNRTRLSANCGSWPNIIKFDINGTNTIKQSDVAKAVFYFQYGGDSNLTASVCIDRDFNPYNSNSLNIVTAKLPPTGTNSAFYSQLDLPTSNVAPGLYTVSAKISGGARTRYLYASTLLKVLPSSQAPVLDISRFSDSDAIISISGVSGQKVILQFSEDLANWTSIATNTMVNSNWSYAATMTNHPEFYRAVLAE